MGSRTTQKKKIMGRTAKRMNGTRHGKKFWSDEKENFGFKALAKMGWTPGTGVGKERQGRTKCITMVVKNDFAGIGGKNTNVTKHRAIVSMYNDILKKANKPKSEKKTPTLSVEGYMMKNALYRRFRVATINEFQLKETEVVLSNKKRKKKGFTMDDQERIALAQADLKNSGRKGLGFGKPQAPVSIPTSVKPSESAKKDKKKKKKKKRKRAESTDSPAKVTESADSSANVAEKFLDGLMTNLTGSPLTEKKKRQKVASATETAEKNSVKKSKKKKKRKLTSGDEKPAKRRKTEVADVDTQPDESAKKAKKKKKKKAKQIALSIESSSIESVKSKKKKKKKSKASSPKAEEVVEKGITKSKKKK